MKARDLHHELNHHRKAGAHERKTEPLEVLHCRSCGVIYDLGPVVGCSYGGFCSDECAEFERYWNRYEED